jgi:hypothetical protein
MFSRVLRFFILCIILIVALYPSQFQLQMADQPRLIHQIKYTTLKIMTTKEDIKFNKKCLQENIVPDYVQLNTKSKSIAAKKTLQKGRIIWIKEEINSLYSKLKNLNDSLEELNRNLRLNFHQESIEEFTEYINSWIDPRLKKKKETHDKKIRKLCELQKPMLLNEMQDTSYTFYPTMKNLTDIEFNEEESAIINKSLKYNVNMDYKPKEIEDGLIEVDVAIKSTPKEIQDSIRINFIHEMNKNNNEIVKNNIKERSNKELKLIKSISEKLKENNSMIAKADKSNTVVIIKNEDYDKKVIDFIEKNEFKELKKDPTPEYNKILNNTISKCKTLSKNEKNRLKTINPDAPNLRGQPKIHKNDIPIRPVVNYQNAPAYKISKYLNKKIQEYIIDEINYSVKNTHELISKIKDVKIGNEDIFLSFDVVSMYTKIPVKETLNILKQKLTKNNNLTKNQVEDIIRLTKTATDQNYFQYNGKFYKQEDGLAMGSPLSGLLANIYMTELETEKIMNECNPYRNKIVYWHRYVDDIICLYKGNSSSCTDLKEYLNKISRSIKFTMESQDNQINYLDINIRKENNHHSFKIYRKDTQTDLVIPADSNHPWQHKMAAFYSMINRLVKIPLQSNDYEKEKKIIKQLAVKNGYKNNLIDKLIKKATDKKNEENIAIRNVNQMYICMPYNATLNKSIRKTFQGSQYKISYRTKNNCFRLIQRYSKNNQLMQNNKYDRSGVYEIKCAECPKYYIGQTGRAFSRRYKEHIQSIKSNNRTSQKSIFADHILASNHSYNKLENGLKILEFEKKGTKLDSKEELHIYLNSKKDNNILNKMMIQKENPIYEKIQQIRQRNQQN